MNYLKTFEFQNNINITLPIINLSLTLLFKPIILKCMFDFIFTLHHFFT